MTLYNEWCKIKRNYPPTGKELIDFLIAAVVVGFVVSFNSWGTTTFDAAIGINNLVITIGLAALTIAIHHSAQRLAALWQDAKVEHRLWHGGSLASLLLCFATAGAVPFITVTRAEISNMPIQRLGHYRYNISTVGKMMALLAGPTANMLVGFLLLALTGLAPSDIMATFISMNLLFGVFSLLPIPPLEGAYVFYVSRWFYAAIFTGTLAAGAGYMGNILGWQLLLLVIVAMAAGGFAWWFALDRD